MCLLAINKESFFFHPSFQSFVTFVLAMDEPTCPTCCISCEKTLSRNNNFYFKCKQCGFYGGLAESTPKYATTNAGQQTGFQSAATLYKQYQKTSSSSPYPPNNSNRRSNPIPIPQTNSNTRNNIINYRFNVPDRPTARGFNYGEDHLQAVQAGDVPKNHTQEVPPGPVSCLNSMSELGFVKKSPQQRSYFACMMELESFVWNHWDSIKTDERWMKKVKKVLLSDVKDKDDEKDEVEKDTNMDSSAE